MNVRSCVGLVLLGLASGAAAQYAGGMRQGPPSEAFSACQGRESGSACRVEGPMGSLDGICRELREGIACVPEGMDRGGMAGGKETRRGPGSAQGQQPPGFAIEACSALAEGDGCRVTTPRGDSLDGTCEMLSGTLACRPERPPMGGPR